MKYNQKALKKRICKDYICFEFFARCMGTSTEHLFAMLQGVEKKSRFPSSFTG